MTESIPMRDLESICQQILLEKPPSLIQKKTFSTISGIICGLFNINEFLETVRYGV